MYKRTKICLAVVTLTVIGLVASRLWWHKEDWRPPLASLSAPISASTAKIAVGKNVQVSLANAEIQHYESVVAADPRDPSRLFIASMFEPIKGKDTNKLVGYCSLDRGMTWRLALEQTGDPPEGFGDPTATFGPDGSVYLAYIRNKSSGANLVPGSPDGRIEFIRSSDGGKTWHEPTNIPQWYDRPWIAIDPSDGPYRSRLYCIVKGEGTLVFMSLDQGKTFSPPHSWPIDLTKYHPHLRPGNPVVLSDGTVVVHYDLRSKDYSLFPLIRVLVSRDGGESFQTATPVNTAWRDNRVTTGGARLFPQMAADTQSDEHRDRLYCIWEDGATINQQRLFLSSSADKGQTWSTPQVLSEQPTGSTEEGDYSTFMPSIAVNKRGVVAVSWYDRRGLPKQDHAGDTNVGCNVRLRVSVDGGDTWLPSVQLNEKAIDVRCGVQGGELWHTAGIAADADGDFHPAWIDNRTGTRQVWTSTIRVETK